MTYATAMVSLAVNQPNEALLEVTGQLAGQFSAKVIGTAAAIQGATVRADLPGTIDKIHFESGQWVKEGEILVELDTRQERAQLASLEAQRDLAKVNYDRAQQLVGAGVIAKQEYATPGKHQVLRRIQESDARVVDVDSVQLQGH